MLKKKKKKKKSNLKPALFCFTLQLTGCLFASTAEEGGRESGLWVEKEVRKRKEWKIGGRGE